jgi:hypothetical protein
MNIRGLRIFFVQFYIDKVPIKGGKSYIPATDRHVAMTKVKKMIASQDQLVPVEFDSWRVE